MGEELSSTEARTLAYVLVCGDVQSDTIYSASAMMTTSQERALDRLDEKGFLEHTLYGDN